MKSVPLNSLALLWIMSASLIIGGLFEWPLHIVLAAGQNAGIAYLGGLCWAFLVAALIRTEAPTGRFWTGILGVVNALALMGVIAVDATMLVQLLGMMQTFFYWQTPRWALTIPLVMLSVMAASARGDTRWRVITLWTPLLFMVSLPVIGMAGLVSIRHGRVLLPNTVLTISPLIQGVGAIAYLGFPLGVTFRVLRTQMAEPPSLTWRLAAVSLPSIFLALLLVLALGALGTVALIHVRWPVIFTLNHITIHGAFFLSRIGIIVIFTWTLGIGLGLIAHLALASQVVASRWQPLSSVVPYIIGAGWLAISFLIPSPEAATVILNSWIEPVAETYVIVELLLTIIVRLFSKPKAPQGDAARET